MRIRCGEDKKEKGGVGSEKYCNKWKTIRGERRERWKASNIDEGGMEGLKRGDTLKRNSAKLGLCLSARKCRKNVESSSIQT